MILFIKAIKEEKRMKKIFALLLAVTAIATMSVTAFAATPIDGEDDPNPVLGIGVGEYTVGVNGVVVKNTVGGDVISVDIQWDSMNFEYKDSDVGQWQPEDHTYEYKTPGGWIEKKAGIQVTNHSNVDINVDYSFAPSSETGVTGGFYTSDGSTYTAVSSDSQKFDLKAAERGSAQDAADKATRYFGITGGSVSSNASLGIIKINIKNATAMVSTIEELATAVEKGGPIRLMNDIVIANKDDVLTINNDTVLDLNGYKLSAGGTIDYFIENNSSLVVKNGTLENLNQNSGAINNKQSLTVLNCYLLSNYYAIYNRKDAVITDSEFVSPGTNNHGSIMSDSIAETDVTLELSGKILISSGISKANESATGAYKNTVVAKAGAYNFDPTAYVDTDLYYVMRTGMSSWSVTAN